MSTETSELRPALRRWPSATLLWSALILFPLLTTVWALTIGRFPVSFGEVMTILGLPVIAESGISATATSVVWQVRVPRVLEALVCGAGLGVAGAALQGVFRNPLVGPQIIGVSTGAAFGGALSIFAGLGLAGLLGLAFSGGIVALLSVFALSRMNRGSSLLMVVLAGVVVSAFFGALVSLVTYLADPNDSLPAIVYWLMGSFATANYDKLMLVTGVTVVASAVLLALRFRINLLSLGDEEARAFGVPVERIRWTILLSVTLIVSAGVAVAGVIGWVGLVVPHLARMMVGPDHRQLLPAAALVGGGFMVLVDTAARSLTLAEIPLGVLTAIIGAPIFAWLLRRTKDGGWQ
ncbi:MAG: FecCD family ABC transporter permease [Saccharospirillum sp.]